VLCFSNRGQVYWLKVHQLPQAGRNARGKPMVNLLPLEEGEKINAVLPVKQYDEQHFVFMATSQGTVKKTPLDAFSRPRSAGIIAIDLHDNDRLVGVALTDGQREVILVTSGGKAIRFPEEEVRPMGREAAGVRGVKLGEGQEQMCIRDSRAADQHDFGAVLGAGERDGASDAIARPGHRNHSPGELISAGRNAARVKAHLRRRLMTAASRATAPAGIPRQAHSSPGVRAASPVRAPAGRSRR